MANLKISELTAAGALTGAELVELVQGGVNKKSTTQDIANLGGGGGAWGTITGTLSSQTDLQNELDLKADLTAVIGIQDFFIPASAFWPRTTAGSSILTRREIATSLVNIQSLNFDQTTQEFAQVLFRLPKKYNLGTFTYEVKWTAEGGSGTVQWGVSGGAYSNDDALTTALGTAVTVDDTLIAADDNHDSPTSAAVTLAGSPAIADTIVIQISRNPASDTLSGDAEFLGICLHITTNAPTDV